MNLTAAEVQNLLHLMGAVMASRAEEGKIIDQFDGVADLNAACTATDAAILDLKRAVASHIKASGLAIVQEGDALPQGDAYVIMPASIECDC